jgi:cysteine desulfurase / selenocysteine lyase
MREGYAEDFGPFEGAIWLNCAHQGALPRVAAAEAEEAVAWKRAPWNLKTERFGSVPLRLRQALGRLIGAPHEDIILGNSASYGLHLLANGIRWQAGDEVLLMEGDFPSDILPWLTLERRGVGIRIIPPKRVVLEPEELLRNITASTKLLCLSLAHSFSGYAVNAEALGEICRDHGVVFVLNISQALGARCFSVASTPVDAVTSVGFKWLCGPYGTGFCWIKPELRESLEYNQAYWLSMQTADELVREPAIPLLRSDLGARRFDVFGTANFFNFKPWAASIEYLLSQGLENIEAYDQQLVTRLIEGIDPGRYDLHSPRSGPSRSTLVFISDKRPERNNAIYEELLARKIFIALRAGKLRLSPHLHNTHQDVDEALSVLNSI